MFAAASFEDAFLRPPLFSTAYDNGFGTLYTAAYRSVLGLVDYRWPSFSWRLGFDEFVEAEHTEVLAEGRSPNAAVVMPDGRASIVRRWNTPNHTDRGKSMESVETRTPSAPMILGIVGGVAMAIGSFLNWATVSVDFDKIAAAVGIDPSQIPGEIRAQGIVSVTGWDAGDGKWTLVAGVVVVVAAALLAMASSRGIVGIVMVVAGVVGGGLALYDATIQKNDVIDNAASAFAGIGLPGALRDYFSLSLGIGIWLCIAGGIVAIVAGIMAIASQGSTVPATTVAPTGFTPPPPPSVPDAGFGIAGVGGSLVPPVVPAPAAEADPEPEPTAPQAEPKEGSGTGVPAGEDPPPSP